METVEKQRTYIAIDLKSFYASVECVERGLNPLDANLVVADSSRTEKTICLAVSPALKAYGISGRARLFEVVQKVKEVNGDRLISAPKKQFTGKSCFASELKEHPEYELDYIAATPRMAYYMHYSTLVLQVYLKYIAPEDMHVYSVDEVFLDVTAYLNTYRMTAKELAQKMIREVMETTGITATAGIGTNMFLCKVAMDVVAKHIQPDANGVRIAELDEKSFRELLWDHRPITDIWRIGRGTANKLEKYGMYTLGDVARCSIGKETDYQNEALLYKLFGVNAELLIDHAWGWEPCTIKDIKEYKPMSNSLSSGQVLKQPYDYEKGRVIIREMTDLLALDLVDKKLVTDQLVLTIGYDIENLKDGEQRKKYRGEVTFDHYGRPVPKHCHGSKNLGKFTSSAKKLLEAITELYDECYDRELTMRRVSICANHVKEESLADQGYEQLDLFTDYEKVQAEKKEEEKQHNVQKAVLDIQKKFGKNAILRGMNYSEGATTIERNGQIGGHKA